jgi:hypothetical protein
LSTNTRLSLCGRTNARGGVDSPRSSGFRIALRIRSSSSSYVQVLRMAPGLEGAPTKHSMMGPDDGDDNKYIPR